MCLWVQWDVFYCILIPMRACMCVCAHTHVCIQVHYERVCCWVCVSVYRPAMGRGVNENE